MKYPWWIALVLLLTIGCQSSTPTAAPTQPPATATAQPTSTPLPPTPVPPTATLAQTALPPTPTPTPIPVTGTIKSDVNVRELPSTASKALGQLRKGDSVVLQGRNLEGTWFTIPFPSASSNTQGWVIAAALVTFGPTQTLSVAVPVTSTGTVTSTVTRPLTPTPGGTVTATATVTRTPVVSPTVKPSATVTGPVGSPAGTILFDVFTGRYDIRSVKADGTGLTTLMSGASEPALSPNGALLAWHARVGAPCANLGVSQLNGTSCTSLTKESTAGYPSWSPDGRSIVFNALPSGNSPSRIVVIPSSGTSEVDTGVVTFGKRPAWQPVSGEFIAYDGCKPDGSNCNSIFLVRPFSGSDQTPTLVTHGTNPAWSPDGRRLAFQDGDGKGNLQIFEVNRDGSGRRQVTTNPGNNGTPIWSSDGQWIFYRSDQGGAGWAIKAIRLDGRSEIKIVDAPVNPDSWDQEKLAIGR